MVLSLDRAYPSQSCNTRLARKVNSRRSSAIREVITGDSKSLALDHFEPLVVGVHSQFVPLSFHQTGSPTMPP